MLKTVTFKYTGSVQTWTPPKGVVKIKIECWGAQGGGSMRDGNVNSDGAPGGYCYGEYIFKENSPRKLQIYVGSAGRNGGRSNAPGGWNGGGYGTYDGRDDEGGGGGGGATDVRLIAASPDSWYDTSHKSWENDKSLLSRIIVAGGGGGLSWTFPPGVGGGLIGGNGNNTTSTPASQTEGYAFGKGQDAYSVVWDGGNGNVGQGGGGGGWYGGYTLGNYPTSSGCGGSSYYGNLINAGTIAGKNIGDGKVVLTYCEEYFFIERNGEYYIINKENFDVNSKSFFPVTLLNISHCIKNGEVFPFSQLNESFTIDGTKYTPSSILDFTKCRLCIFNGKNLYKIKINYKPSSIALSKTNMKIKDKYTPIHDELEPTFLDITSTDKSKIDYFIDYNQTKLYKNCSILNKDTIIHDFYANFKLNSVDSLLKSITLYGKNNDKYTKLNEASAGIYYDNLNDRKLIRFASDYKEVKVNKITKQSVDYTVDTLDKF